MSRPRALLPRLMSSLSLAQRRAASPSCCDWSTPRQGPTATRLAATHADLTQGEKFFWCVTVTVRIPLLPEFIDENAATGQFVVERDRYVDG